MELCEIPRWQQLKLTITNLNYRDFVSSFKEDEKGLCIDVRTSGEYSLKHIKGAQNLNYLDQDLADQLESLPKDKNYYVYCRSGRRSLRVCVLMKNMNLNSVNLGEGYIDQL